MRVKGFCSTAAKDRDSLGGMSKTFRAWNVDQVWLFPPSVQDFVPAKHVAHFVRETVRTDLDLGAIFACYSEERGYPPYHPAMMVALLLYGYSRGVYSSRQLERACEERVDFMAVTGMSRPDFRTIAEFRRRHLKALGELFVQVLRLCREAGLVKLGHVALDGTKIKANASKHKAMSYGRMREAEAKLQAEVRAWFARAEAADAEEDRAHGAERGDELPDWVADKQQRLERLRRARAALEAEAKAPPSDDDGPGPSTGMMDHGKPKRAPDGRPPDRAQRNFTDPDSRIQQTRDGVIQATTRRSPSTARIRSSSPSACRPMLRTAARSFRWSRRSAATCVPSPKSSRPTPLIVTRPISPFWPSDASPPISRRAGRATARAIRPASDECASARTSPPWQRSSAVPAGAADIACASRSSSRCSARSKRPEASDSSCSAAWTRSERNGR